jgi:hypothetical protein
MKILNIINLKIQYMALISIANFKPIYIHPLKYLKRFEMV